MGKSKYETHVQPKMDVIRGWSRDGLTLDQIASNLGVSHQSLIKYKTEHVELFETLKGGKDEADYEVVNALFKNATGFYYTEETVTNQGEVVEVRKFHAPNTTAQIFWLKNRQPDKWREKQEHKHEVTASLADVLTQAWSMERGGDDGGSNSNS